jgi:ferrochelatase
VKKAVVLLNMGGARSRDELRLFLTNMFNDPNIMTIKNKYLRAFVAKMIVTMRTDKAWENYKEIGGKTPLHLLTDELIDKLQTQMEDTFVTCAMRYTPKFAKTAVEEIKEKGIEKVILVPLYPQFSTTTTKSSVEDFKEFCDDNIEIKTVKPFYKDELYNEAICDEVLNVKGDDEDYHLIFSAHGLPQKIVDKGDPYQKQLEVQLEILKEKLDSKFQSISLAYQSKVGPMKWLEPSLDSALEKFKDKKVIIYPIAFIIDNSESVFELEIEYREMAQEIGLKEFKVCKCLNSDEKFVDSLIKLINKK